MPLTSQVIPAVEPRLIVVPFPMQVSLLRVTPGDTTCMFTDFIGTFPMLNAAGNILNALLNEVRAQSRKSLDDEMAAHLNSTVREATKELEITQSKLDKHSGKSMSVDKSAAKETPGENKPHGKNDESRGNHGAAKWPKADKNNGKCKGLK